MVPAWVAGTFCPLLGMVIVTFMWLSPWKGVMDAKKAKDIGPLNIFPFLIACVQCIGWTIYGCMIRDYYVFWGNSTGIVLGLYYTLNCLALMARRPELDEKREMCQNLLVIGIGFWCLMGMIASIVYGLDDYSRLQGKVMIGTISCAGGLSYYASPLSTLVDIIRKRDSSSLYEPMIIVNFLNALLWSIYGKFAINDIMIWGPNSVGIVLSIIQMFTSRVFPKTEQLALEMKLRNRNSGTTGSSTNQQQTPQKINNLHNDDAADMENKDVALQNEVDGRGNYQSPFEKM